MLHGRRELLERMRPFLGGGHMISRVERERSAWNDLPFKFEAGTSAATEAVGLGAAVEYLAALGMQNVRAHERELTAYALERLRVDGIRCSAEVTSIAAAGSSRSRSRACTRTTSPSSAIARQSACARATAAPSP